MRGFPPHHSKSPEAQARHLGGPRWPTWSRYARTGRLFSFAAFPFVSEGSHGRRGAPRVCGARCANRTDPRQEARIATWVSPGEGLAGHSLSEGHQAPLIP